MGIQHKAMKIVACILFVGLAIASQTEYIDLAGEIPAPPGETDDSVEMIQERSGVQMRDTVVYRISWNTMYDRKPSKTASKGTYTINIKGADSETGAQTLVTHPGYQCGAASDPECFPNIQGKVLADDDASLKCACDPSKDGYDEAAAKWRPFAGTTQHYYLKGTDVGEITEVVIAGDSNANDSWSPGFLKINMNDMETGVGNGIYYMDIGKKINKDKPLTLKAGATDAYGEKIKMEKLSSHQYGIIKCEAGACEKKMEKLMGNAAKETKKEK